jgi:hypothetical protein
MLEGKKSFASGLFMMVRMKYSKSHIGNGRM